AAHVAGAQHAPPLHSLQSLPAQPTHPSPAAPTPASRTRSPTRAPSRSARSGRRTSSREPPRGAPGGETWARNLTPLPPLRNAESSPPVPLSANAERGSERASSVALLPAQPQIARSMRSPLRLPVAATTYLLLIPALTGGAMLVCQQPSAYVPLDDWTMPYVEHLIATGAIRDPAPLTRPLRRSDVLRALAAADTVHLSPAATATLRRLRTAFATDPAVPHFRVAGGVGAAAANYARRDALAAIDSTGPRQAGAHHGTAGGDLELDLVTNHVVAAARLQIDTRLKYDPDWFGKKDRAIAGRTAEAYLDAQWKFGDVFFGRMDRNWGPPGIQGLLLSANPYGLDHFAISVGSAKLQFQAIATQLDDRDSMGLVVHRFMVQHRLVFAPRRWGVALWEGTVLAGRDRSFEPWYLNALNVGILEQWNSGG